MTPDEPTANVIPFPDARTKRAEDSAAIIEAIEPGHALVPVGETSATGSHAETRRDCGFIAQLIASKVQAPQTRARRRAEPDEAVQTYQLSLAAVHRTGETFARKS